MDVRISCKNREDYSGFEQDVYLEDRFDGLDALDGMLTADQRYEELSGGIEELSGGSEEPRDEEDRTEHHRAADKGDLATVEALVAAGDRAAFPDAASLVLKAPDDLRAIIAQRVAEAEEAARRELVSEIAAVFVGELEGFEGIAGVMGLPFWRRGARRQDSGCRPEARFAEPRGCR